MLNILCNLWAGIIHFTVYNVYLDSTYNMYKARTYYSILYNICNLRFPFGNHYLSKYDKFICTTLTGKLQSA